MILIHSFKPSFSYSINLIGICSCIGGSEIYDKYHECVLEKFHKVKLSDIFFQGNKSGTYPKFSLLYQLNARKFYEVKSEISLCFAS